jgi:hypothetical protein
MRHHAAVVVAVACLACPGARGIAFAQSTAGRSPSARPWSRISFFTNSSQLRTIDGQERSLNELTTTFTAQMPELEGNGFEYGVDVRFSAYSASTRPERTSIYEGYVGGRFANGSVGIRAGHLWLNDIGSLGSVAGGVVEIRQSRSSPDEGRLRVVAFGGLEPDILDTGYASNVRKFGGYLAYDGSNARRHVIGAVMVKNASIAERSVLTATNYIPVRQKLFIYQTLEYDVRPPAGQAAAGLTYFFLTGHVAANDRLEVQGTYNRGRSIDARSLSEDVLAGRALSTRAVDGFLYESLGGRVTVEVAPRVRVYSGYARDKNNRDAQQMGRFLFGGYAGNLGGSGLDLTASDSMIQQPTGHYHSQYVSVGRQIGRSVYVSGDYSTSLSVIRFSRSDGIVVEMRPHMSRFSGTASINVGRSVSLLTTLEQTSDDQSHDLRLLSGITYRTR